MGLLRIALALAVTACYAPDIRDCTLACAADTDCVTGQVCTADHWCAAPALSSGCGELARDAGADSSRDARPADARPDAEVDIISLHIHIDGQGFVVVTAGPTCDASDCTFAIPKGVPAILTAMPHGNHPFERWTSPVCMDAPTACAFTPTTNVTVSAKFK